MNQSSPEFTHLDHPAQEELLALVRGELKGLRRTQVEEHLLSCETCCARLDEQDQAAVDEENQMLDLVREVATHGDTWFDGARETAKGADDESLADESSSPEDIAFLLSDHPRYRIVSKIGSGGMGTVYRARHRLMRRDVVIKVINRQLMLNKTAAARFRREVRAAARLSHPGIVAALDSEEYRGLYFLVMEYIDGVDLASLVDEQGPLPLAKACDYIRQAAEGLQHAYERRMIHRDIKPHNLMLTSDGVVKILDFGLARFVSEQRTDDEHASLHDDDEGLSSEGLSTMEGFSFAEITRFDTLMGTLGYAAPEQLTDPASADIRSDIYGLGAALHFFLTGRPPVPSLAVSETQDGSLAALPEEDSSSGHEERDTASGDSQRSGETAHADSAVERCPDTTVEWEELPPEIVPVLRRMLAANPDDRFQTPVELVTALHAFAPVYESAVTVTLPPGTSATAPRTRRTLKTAALLIVPCLAAALVWFVNQHEQSPVPAEIAGHTGLLPGQLPSESQPQMPAGAEAISDGLVAWWPLDEYDGETVRDVSGNGRDGRFSESGYAPSPAVGRIGSGLDFRGAREAVTIDPPIDLQDEWTVALWVRRNQSLENAVLVGSDSGNAILLERAPPKHRLGVIVDQKSEPVGHKTLHAEWEHVTFVGSENSLRVYSDGKLLLVKTLSMPLVISEIGSSTRGALTATLDDIRIFDRALSSEEVQTIARINASPSPDPDSVATTSTEPVLIDVLGNDRDLEGHELRLESISTALTTYRFAFKGNSLTEGWSLFWNAPADWNDGYAEDLTTSPIGDVSSYRPLVFYDVELPRWGIEQSSAGSELWDPSLQFNSEGGHPGYGKLDRAEDAGHLDRYAIAAFRVPQAGDYTITNSRINSRNATNNNGGDIRVYAGTRLIHTGAYHKGSSAPFNASLGHIANGETIYVAAGPRGYNAADAFTWDFQINGPASNSWLLSTLGARISMKSDGTVQYDPTASATLRNLAPDEQLTDRFIYTVSDEQGAITFAEVEVVVTGV